MKTIALSVLLLGFSAVPALAMGMPQAHGVDGKTFGDLVSSSAPINEHVSNSHDCEHGMPAMHGLTGQEFGGAVSGLAGMYPGAVAEHVK